MLKKKLCHSIFFQENRREEMFPKLFSEGTYTSFQNLLEILKEKSITDQKSSKLSTKILKKILVNQTHHYITERIFYKQKRYMKEIFKIYFI